MRLTVGYNVAGATRDPVALQKVEPFILNFWIHSSSVKLLTVTSQNPSNMADWGFLPKPGVKQNNVFYLEKSSFLFFFTFENAAHL